MQQGLMLLATVPLIIGASGTKIAQPAYASKEDLGTAIRCSALEAATKLRDRKFDLLSVTGTANYKRVVDVSKNVSASANGLTLFIPIDASGSISRSTIRTMETGEIVGVSAKGKPGPGCATRKIRTLNKKGYPGTSVSAKLFTDTDIVPAGTNTAAVKVVTISESFKKTDKAEAGTGFTLFGLLKHEAKASVTSSSENGYSLTFCFRPPSTNAAGNPLNPEQVAAACK